MDTNPGLLPAVVEAINILNGKRTNRSDFPLLQMKEVIVVLAFLYRHSELPKNPKSRRKLARALARAVCRENTCLETTFVLAADTVKHLGYEATVLNDLFHEPEIPTLWKQRLEKFQSLLAPQTALPSE